MRKGQAGGWREAVALLAATGALALSGCIFLTPPTGLRLGDHANEYPPSSGAGALALRRYTAPDFEVLVPELWPAKPLIDVLNPQAPVAQRVAYGISFSDAPGDEGLLISTLLVPGLKDEELFANARAIAQGSVAQPVVAADEAATLGGKPARRLEVSGVDPAASAAVRLMVAAAGHQGFGYLVVLRTIEARHSVLRPVFLAVLDQFKFLEAPLPSFGMGQPHPELDATQAAQIRDAVASAEAQAKASAAAQPAASAAGPATGTVSPVQPRAWRWDRPARAGL